MPLELQFVTAEEAAKWPEGTTVIVYSPTMKYEFVGHWWIPQMAKMFAHWGYDRFARLPDTLPDLSEEPSDVR